MSRRSTWGFVGIGLAGVVGAVLWASEFRRIMQTLGECLRPTTVEMMPLPRGCIPTTEAPPAELMRIIDYQERFYHLTRQKLIVCMTALSHSQSEPDFSEAAFTQEVRKRWLPLYVGCCSYQFRRHVTVVAAKPQNGGSVIVEAALIESRWDFFRLNWSKDRSPWF